MAGHFIRLNGSNPTWAGNYAFSNATGGASVHWQQAKSGRLSVLAEYVRGALYSDILYRDPASFGSLRSLYRDNLHSATLLTDFKLHSRLAVSAGGTLLRTGGTRPTSYYQPQGRITMPLRANCEFFAEWRYYDFGQVIFSREQFRTHQIMIALRIKTAPATKK